MGKIFISLFLILLSLAARENPFFPQENEEDIPLTSNAEFKDEPLKRAALSLPSTARNIERVEVTYKNLDGSIATKSIDLQNSIDWHLPIFISQNYSINRKPTPSKVGYKKLATLSFAKFYTSKKALKLLSKDMIIRDFLLVKPHRIVVDLKRDIDIRGFSKVIKNSAFTKLRVGNHKGYYRLVFELDGYYSYRVEKIEGGYIFSLI